MIAVVAFLAFVVCYLGAGVTYARIRLRKERQLDGEGGFIAFMWPFVALFDVLDWLVKRGQNRAD